MTEVDEIVIENFESKLNRLMGAYTQLSQENLVLRNQLNHQSVELDEVRKQYATLQESYSELKLAKIISIDETDLGETKKRLSQLVREVDRCIALLKASEQKEDTL